MMMDEMTVQEIRYRMSVMRPEARGYQHNAPTTLPRLHHAHEQAREPARFT